MFSSSISVHHASVYARSNGTADAETEGGFSRDLIDRIIFGRQWIPNTYHFTIGAVLLVFALRHWLGILWEAKLASKGRSPSSRRRDSAISEESALLDSTESKTRNEGAGTVRRLLLKARAILMYQPPPIPYVNKVLPSNATSLLIIILLAINIFYLTYYTGSTMAIFTACIMDRAGLLFAVNLPWLYLLAAKNQPIRLLTGDSYEGLNILHRRLGEWMCLLAVWHVLGFFAFWWYYILPVPGGESLKSLLLQGFVLIGIGAFVCYELLWAMSLASFRQWWYELFLASHVVLQAAGLVLLFFHHPRGKVVSGVSLAVFVVDRVVYRFGLKSRKVLANLEILEDRETMLISANWSLPAQPSWWRQVFGKDIRLGWKPLEHVFITIPVLGRGHALQAHPFTIASAAPEGQQQHAWLSIIARARDGFTKDLLHYAQSHTTVGVRLDGPYGSHHAMRMLRASDTAIVVAGGSGIAVAYPIIWSLLHHSSSSRLRKVCLIWIVREASHISWIGIERLEELKELGLYLVLPDPTTKSGRPDVGRLVAEAVDDLAGTANGSRIGVVVSAPDALNRDVNNTCARLAWEGRDTRVAVEKFGW